MKKSAKIIAVLSIVFLAVFGFFRIRSAYCGIRFSKVHPVINRPIGMPYELPTQFVFSENSAGTMAVYSYSPSELAMFDTYTLSKKVIKHTDNPCTFCIPAYYSNKICVSEKDLSVYFVFNDPADNAGKLLEFAPRESKTTTIFESNGSFINDFASDGNKIILTSGKNVYVSRDGGRSFERIGNDNIENLFPDISPVARDVLLSSPFLSCGITGKGEYSYIGGCNGYFIVSRDFFGKDAEVYTVKQGFFHFVNKLIFVGTERSGTADFILLSNPVSPGNEPALLRPNAETVRVVFDGTKNENAETVKKFVLPKSIIAINDALIFGNYLFIATNNGIFYSPLESGKFKKVPGVFGNILNMFTERNGSLYFDEYDTESPGMYCINITYPRR